MKQFPADPIEGPFNVCPAADAGIRQQVSNRYVQPKPDLKFIANMYNGHPKRLENLRSEYIILPAFLSFDIPT
jgi:hypothetical protein